MEFTDRELIQRVLLLDDRGAYSTLVQRYQRQVRAYLFRRTRDREWADDLAQESFLQAYRNLSQLSSSDQFRGWLFTIAHRQFLQAYRTRSEAPMEFIAVEIEDVGLGARIELKSLLRSLRPIEQEAIILCLGHEFSHSEAAEILGLSIGTVKSLVLRAREKLRFENRGGGHGLSETIYR